MNKRFDIVAGYGLRVAGFEQLLTKLRTQNFELLKIQYERN